jgi:hypothetical protein
MEEDEEVPGFRNDYTDTDNSDFDEKFNTNVDLKNPLINFPSYDFNMAKCLKV